MKIIKNLLSVFAFASLIIWMGCTQDTEIDRLEGCNGDSYKILINPKETRQVALSGTTKTVLSIKPATGDTYGNGMTVNVTVTFPTGPTKYDVTSEELKAEIVAAAYEADSNFGSLSTDEQQAFMESLYTIDSAVTKTVQIDADDKGKITLYTHEGIGLLANLVEYSVSIEPIDCPDPIVKDDDNIAEDTQEASCDDNIVEFTGTSCEGEYTIAWEAVGGANLSGYELSAYGKLVDLTDDSPKTYSESELDFSESPVLINDDSECSVDILFEDCDDPDPLIGATCTDGIQNGDEEGVDCGGSQCEPCESGNPTVTFNGATYEITATSYIGSSDESFNYLSFTLSEEGEESLDFSISLELYDDGAFANGTYSYDAANQGVSTISQVTTDNGETWHAVTGGSVTLSDEGLDGDDNQLYGVTLNLTTEGGNLTGTIPNIVGFSL